MRVSQLLKTLLLLVLLWTPNLHAQYCPYNRLVRDPGHKALAEGVRAGVDPHFISVVVPVYRELENGNIARYLESFTAQGAHAKQFELVMIVNNTPEAVAENSPVFQENQRTIQLLKYAGRETNTPPDFFSSLPRWQQEVVQRARAKELNIKIVDLSTAGIEKSMGVIRDTGVQKTLESHKDIEENHIFAMMDADTLVNPGYIENIAAHFHDPKLNMLSLGRNWRVEAGSNPFVYQSSYQFRYGSALAGLKAAGQLHAEGGGGPQTIARAAAVKKVGGYMHIGGGEDGMLSMDIMNLGQYRTPHDVQVFIGDRFRPDGYDAIYRQQGANYGVEREVSIQKEMLGEALSTYFRKNQKMSPQEAERFFNYYGVPFNLATWNEKFDGNGKHKDTGPYRNADFSVHAGMILEPIQMKQDSPAAGFRAFIGTKLSPTLIAELDRRLAEAETNHNAAVKTIRDTVRKMTEGPVDLVQTRFQQPMVDEFLSGNTWLADKVREGKARGENADQILAGLEKEFPDWFLTYSATPFKRDVDSMELMRDFMRETTFNAESHPSLRKLARTMEGVVP